MKSRILIIEENYCKFFTIKQVLESQLKLKVEVVGARSREELMNTASEIDPNLLVVNTQGGVLELMDKLKERKFNRRNAEVTLIAVSESFENLDSDLNSACSKTTNHAIANAA